MYAFTYHRASSVKEAEELLSGSGEIKLLAGGQTLIPTLKQHLANPSTLVDIGHIESLKFIRVETEVVVIGAATTHGEVATSDQLAESIPALARLASQIGDPHVRNTGTIGGSIANNDPAADYPSACIALAAIIRTNKREIGADEFFTGMFTTALEKEEIIREVVFPVPERGGYAKFPHPASRYALVGVFVTQAKEGVRVAVTGAGTNGVFRLKEMEAALEKSWGEGSINGIRPPADEMLSDLHGDGEYRAHLVNVMAQRAIASA